ncbi:TetR/AcrR family transcriptional regulator [Streptosporangium sp. 'caverna']|uniref:TetR/AcrR family transcriptional regulator n=1 Tax=Streptosporangium sp. 'caverna' TaxID=2202249 RepID=UPI000D7E6125|nr:TetR/AcrR family transcriptional regulator [Streptosporangium sp. 'caverna']AWS43005.1 TetR family transcriptional regulator [Streptosporangium sp. 'caverna']
MKQEAETVGGAPATLWDRTRQLASREILETALRLFTEQGYDETTIAQIAREAGVSQRTLFRYFGTKEDLLGGNQDRFGQVLTDTISELPAEVGVWEALRTGAAAVLALHDSREQALERFRLLHNTASLRAGWLEKQLRFQEDLLPLVEARMDAATGGVGAKARAVMKARAVIATALACLDAASMAWVDNDGRGDIMDLYDECLAAVRG